MKSYVLLFVFNTGKDRVLMIKKARKPVHHIGLLNGIGGKIEGDEDARSAALREFEEETGMSRDDIMDMANFATMSGPAWNVACYWMIADFDENFINETHEGPVSSYDVADCFSWRAVSNIPWLVPMAYESTYTESNFGKATVLYCD